MSDTVHILGIRHHGPGSARSVRLALDQLQPTCVLIEGPPDADELIGFIGRPGMNPPVALLVHDVERPTEAVYYPFAAFSPEWQAMRWAVERSAAVRFIDLPQWHRLAIARQTSEQAATQDESEDDTTPMPPAERDPLQRLAEAAGFDDGERWWEHVVESHAGQGMEVFSAIRDAMAELRSAGGPRDEDEDEPLRESWMRRCIREAIKEGHQSIVVVCGAWHAPVLDVTTTSKKQDDDLLKSLPKIKTSATWVPWTYDRLTYFSGYGAGVYSPGWYEHLWLRQGPVLETWMTQVARLLREKDIDCSSAHVIEAVRLSESLAALRGRPLADLSDIADATRSVFCFDSDLAMQLIGGELLVGHRMGELPDDVPMVPLQQDLARLQKRLRLKPETQDKPLDLDLRNETDRERSVLLHRLRLLGVNWGTPEQASVGKGTFHELWRLQWAPEFAIPLIEAGMLGNTVERAAEAKLAQIARETVDLKSLAEMLQDAMLADLGEAARALVRQIENIAAVAADVTLLMETLPALASLMRYGNVRETDQSMVRQIVEGIAPRITVGLSGAVASLNDEAAAGMAEHVTSTDQALRLLELASLVDDWHAALARIVEQDSVHGLIRGKSARLLLDAGKFESDAIERKLGQALSRGNDPSQGARWLEGFLRGSGLLLIHDSRLLKLIDDWLQRINADLFQELLPLLRRTFSTFPAGERRQIGELLRKPSLARAASAVSARFNRERAARPLPLITQLLGGEP